MNKIDQNAERVKTFFVNKGFEVTLELITDGDKLYFSSPFLLEIKDGSKTEEFIELVLEVFVIDFIPINDCQFIVNIDEDFVICRECGCSEYNACEFGCSWVEEDLCSSCLEKVEGEL